MVWLREAALWRNAPGKRPACVSAMRLPELSGAGQEAAPGSSPGLRTRVMRVANLVRVVAQGLLGHHVDLCYPGAWRQSRPAWRTAGGSPPTATWSKCVDACYRLSSFVS